MNDVLGEAMTSFYHRRSKAKLWVNNRLQGGGPGTRWACDLREEMPIKIYFRDMAEMPEIEWVALQQCRGKILDIGAGSHALALQRLGQKVTALDISPRLAGLMADRGVKKILCQDVFGMRGGRYDTLLLLMNGIGLAGNPDGLRRFLKKARKLLRPGGQLLFDSSDVRYLYNGTPPKGGEYYGAIFYQYEYRRQRSDWFQWLFIDKNTLRQIAAEEGWSVEPVFDAGRDHYLVRFRVQ